VANSEQVTKWSYRHVTWCDGPRRATFIILLPSLSPSLSLSLKRRKGRERQTSRHWVTVSCQAVIGTRTWRWSFPSIPLAKMTEPHTSVTQHGDTSATLVVMWYIWWTNTSWLWGRPYSIKLRHVNSMGSRTEPWGTALERGREREREREREELETERRQELVSKDVPKPTESMSSNLATCRACWPIDGDGSRSQTVTSKTGLRQFLHSTSGCEVLTEINQDLRFQKQTTREGSIE
jgi:hypothetical protein